MAVSQSVAEETLENIRKELTCAACQEHYTDPKILPCLHYYCKECILRLPPRTGSSKIFSCPECHKDITLPEGGVEELKSAFFINRFKSMYITYKKALSKQAHCEICINSEALAEAFCQQCDKFACKNCVHMHSFMKAAFEGHEIISIDQLTKLRAKELVPQKFSPRKCQVHGEFLKIYCFDCSKLICRDCTLKDHKDHDFEFNNEAANKKKKELMEALKPLREVEGSLSQALEEVRNTVREVEGQGDSVANTIETSFEELHTILETHKQQLLEEAKRRVTEKTENLKGQEKMLYLANAGVRSTINYTEQCVNNCSDEEVMSMHTEISQQIQDKMEEHSKFRNRLEPLEEADIGVEVRCAEDLQQLCQKAKVTPHADSIMVNNMPKTAEVSKEIKIEVINTKPKLKNSKLNLQCQIMCVATGILTTPKVADKTPARYEIFYTPSVRGRHELSISVYGQPVPGSPFTMTVYMSPALLDEPVKILDDVPDPHSIAVNSVGEIIVAEYDGDIVVRDDEGKMLRLIEHSHHKIGDLHSVAVDNEDNIYFIGLDSNRIGKANKNCDLLQIRDIKVKQVDKTGYWDIAVFEDEVMVTEWENDGYIMVYDTELNYVRQISGRNKTKLRFLHPDYHGNLYISDDNKDIQVLTKIGDFIRSFSCGVQQLQNPLMVYVCGQYIYVADNDCKETIVSTTEGNYVTTFGCCGGICVNQDGVLYIGDYYKNRITCY